MSDNAVTRLTGASAIAKDTASAIAAAYEQKARKYLSLVGQDLPQTAVVPFLELCRELELNPFKKEVYAVPYKNYKTGEITLSVITGYEVYLKRADRIGKMNGWRCKEDGRIEDWSYNVTVIINRKDWDNPFEHTVYFKEVCQCNKDGMPTQFWQKQPRFMTKKVAIAQGFRLCFPDEFGGMPYTSDEIPQGEIQTKIINDGNGDVCVIADDAAAQPQSQQRSQPQAQSQPAQPNYQQSNPPAAQPQTQDSAKQIQEAITHIWTIANQRELTDQDRQTIANGLQDRRNHTKSYFTQMLTWIQQKPLKRA